MEEIAKQKDVANPTHPISALFMCNVGVTIGARKEIANLSMKTMPQVIKKIARSLYSYPRLVPVIEIPSPIQFLTVTCSTTTKETDHLSFFPDKNQETIPSERRRDMRKGQKVVPPSMERLKSMGLGDRSLKDLREPLLPISIALHHPISLE